MTGAAMEQESDRTWRANKNLQASFSGFSSNCFVPFFVLEIIISFCKVLIFEVPLDNDDPCC